MNRLNRHQFLLGASGTLAGVVAAAYLAPGVFGKPNFAVNPFALGVASGDPASDGFVLWTRLCPQPLSLPAFGIEPGVRFVVGYQIATDPNMRNVVQRGNALAVPELGHSVHVEATGLAPGATYYYKFTTGSFESQIGRAKTAPLAGTTVNQLRFGVTSCADYQYGLWGAYDALAKEDLDFVLFLGDYIYEYGPETGGPRQHNTAEITALADYRARYALYKSDPALRAAHASCPWIVTFDDHETENNYAGLVREIPENPAGGSFAQRRADAYQAYYENMPLRLAALPTGPDMLLYRKLRWGSLAEFSVLDTRQYRSDQPCGDNIQVPCGGETAATQTMTGATQEAWLFDNFASTEARWNVIAQQVMFAKFDFYSDALFQLGQVPGPVGYNMDQWDGYQAARQRILNAVAQRSLSNPIVLSGDIHSAWAHDLKANFANPQSATLGAEFIATSISSQFPTALIQAAQLAVADNPHTKFFDGARRGYLRCTVTPALWTTDFQTVPTDAAGRVQVAIATATTLRTFVVQNGVPGTVSD